MFHNVSPMAAQYQEEKNARRILLTNNDRRLKDTILPEQKCIQNLLIIAQTSDDHLLMKEAQKVLCIIWQRSNNTLSDIDRQAFNHCSERL